MPQEYTFNGILRAQHTDWMGYTNYVFEDLNPSGPDFKYVMCTQFPNWGQSYIAMGDRGFVSVRYVQEGVDTWFNGVEHVPYRNTGVHFLKFVPQGEAHKDVELDLPAGESQDFLEIEFNE